MSGGWRVLALLVCAVSGQQGVGTEHQEPRGHVPMAIKFVVAVNATWYDCLATVSTPLLHSDRQYNETSPLHIGHCDHGPLTFYVTRGSRDGVSKTDVVVTFYTSNFDATPPQCAIPWNGTYLPPRSQDPRDPQLPGCWTSDSQEGWHATDYWFWIMDWDHLL